MAPVSGEAAQLAELVSIELAREEGLVVVAWPVVSPLTGKPLEEIRRALKAETVVALAVRGGTMTAHLFQPDLDRKAWGGSFTWEPGQERELAVAIARGARDGIAKLRRPRPGE
ncbi:MAG: hypothetical protein FJW20_11195 [Acidimicrobiia bacterium]|nr:hypothetical protein [Acidimicrobiia bacterium]